ncbi:hypothetical protein Taro_030140 [Colocasia esculenta]|uniref:Uncharacterized protein n=1 Tax=Colocasia esculenta TaxID=4460 RepID=A0A843VVA5_COLES|nr:hypothetical protein [Colocasia esculenta]
MAAPVEDPLDIADLETLDLNVEETPSEDSPRLPSSCSHDSMTTGSPGGSVGGSDGDGGGDGGNDGDGGGGRDTDHGGPVQYNRRRKFVKGGRAEGSAVDSNSTHESIRSYGGHSYQPESSDTGYSSGYSGYTTTGYPAPYFHPPPSIHVHVPVQQIYAPVEDVQMASLRIVCPGCEEVSNRESAKETSNPCESGHTGGRTNTAWPVPAESTRFGPMRGESDRISANSIRPESALQQTLIQ